MQIILNIFQRMPELRQGHIDGVRVWHWRFKRSLQAHSGHPFEAYAGASDEGCDRSNETIWHIRFCL